GGGLLRSELRPAGPGQGTVRPSEPVPVPAVASPTPGRTPLPQDGDQSTPTAGRASWWCMPVGRALNDSSRPLNAGRATTRRHGRRHEQIGTSDGTVQGCTSTPPDPVPADLAGGGAVAGCAPRPPHPAPPGARGPG